MRIESAPSNRIATSATDAPGASKNSYFVPDGVAAYTKSIPSYNPR